MNLNLENAIAHVPVVALLTFYFVGFALMGLLTQTVHGERA